MRKSLLSWLRASKHCENEQKFDTNYLKQNENI